MCRRADDEKRVDRTGAGGSRRRLYAIALLTASLTALTECLVADHSRSWAEFAQAGLRNLLVVSAALLLVHGLRRRSEPAPAPAEPAPELRIRIENICGAAYPRVADGPTTDDWVTLVRREVAELAAFADHLYAMIDLAGHEAEFAEEAFVRLDDLRWLLGSYVLKGGRLRRLVELPRLLNSIGESTPFGTGDPRRTISAVRTAGTELLHRITDTNLVTADWLLSHRVALPDPDYLDSAALLGRYDRLELEPTTVSGDPLYLLTCHIHDFLDNVESLGDIDHPALDLLEAQLGKVATALENEVTAARAFNIALILLLRETHSADAA